MGTPPGIQNRRAEKPANCSATPFSNRPGLRNDDTTVPSTAEMITAADDRILHAETMLNKRSRKDNGCREI